MKGKIMDIKAMIFFFAKDCRKSPKNSLKIVISAYKLNLVAPLSIVLTQSCMNYEHWIVYQMKEEKRIFPFMYISLRKFMIMIAKNYIEFRFRLFWDTLYKRQYTDKTLTLRKCM